MVDNILLKCRYWIKNKFIEMVRLFKKVYDFYVVENIILELYFNYFLLRILINLKFI